jgi:hypothetical protein
VRTRLSTRAVRPSGAIRRALTGDRGVDTVVEVGGHGTLGQSTKVLAFRGQVSLIGAFAATDASLNFWALFMSQARLQPIATGSRRDLKEVRRVMTQHQIRPVIDSVFTFGDAKAGFNHSAGRKVFGTIVIRHGSARSGAAVMTRHSIHSDSLAGMLAAHFTPEPVLSRNVDLAPALHISAAAIGAYCALRRETSVKLSAPQTV